MIVKDNVVSKNANNILGVDDNVIHCGHCILQFLDDAGAEQLSV